MAQPENKNTKIELEDLLRFKKYERPDDAFWTSFDAKLHQKTLQALVKPQPFWLRLVGHFKTLIHPAFAMPGAAAVALFVFAFSPGTLLVTDSLNPQESSETVVTAQTSLTHTENVSSAATPSAEKALLADNPAALLAQNAKNIKTQFAADTIESEMNPADQNFTKLRAAQLLLSGSDHVQYVASTYTTGSNAYATLPMNAVY